MTDTESFAQALDMLKLLDDSLDILSDEANTAENKPLDDVIDTFGELGETLDFLNSEKVEAHPIDAILEEFGQIEGHLNILNPENGNLLLEVEVLPEPEESYDVVQSITEIVSENISVVPSEKIDEDDTSPFAQLTRFFGSIWEYLAGLTQDDDR